MTETPNAKLKIAICVPSHDTLPAFFAFDLARLTGYLGATLGPDVAFQTKVATGTLIHSARQMLVDELVEDGIDYALWLDSDMRFPKDILYRLMAHKKDLVGINYSTRGVPPSFVAIKKVVWNPEDIGVRCRTDDDSTGLEEVEGVGFGAVLMNTRILRLLHDPKGPKGPWFFPQWLPHGEHVGEDIYFCKLVRDAGVSIFVDHDLSKECAHIGTLEYLTAHAAAGIET